MSMSLRSRRHRDIRPVVDSLEGRALMSGATSTLPQALKPVALVGGVQAESVHATALTTPVVTVINATNFQGYRFVNIDGPNAGNTVGTGTNLNGIANNGIGIGFTIANNGTFTNFTASHWNPYWSRILPNPVNPANAFGLNSNGVVVGTDGVGHAYFLYRGKVTTFTPFGGTNATAFGINDYNTIVGQYTTALASPGFVRFSNNKFLSIISPTGPNVVNAQGINNNGLIVGFYVGNDGQQHGFVSHVQSAKNGVITVTPVADPKIPAVPGEPGATFVFSQILGVNDRGIAVGYYGDSTGSQHGFLYNTHTGVYTFLDDPNAAFHNGVVVTQITGITNSGEIAGFYSDANGVFHGFQARRLY